jgi:winged helix DNA-binding protein
MVVRVGREQVLGYRARVQGLTDDGGGDGGAGSGGGGDGGAGRGGGLGVLDRAVLDIGVQDTPAGSGRLAFAVRGSDRLDGLVLAWTVRGAPHWHRPDDLRPLASALWPRSEADGLAKIAWERSRLSATGMTVDEAIRTTAAALREVVTGPTVKGAVSAAVTARIPARLSHECRACRSTHVFESLLRIAALPAGMRLEPGESPATLVPIEDWPGPPAEQSGVSALVQAYLRLLGPAGPAEVAGWLSTTRTELRPAWPDGLVEVDVDGRKAWIAEPDADALRAAGKPRGVRLLPPSDPYLQARDRAMLVPDPAARKVLWPVLGPPGAVLVDGEIVGGWRTRAAGKRRLQINVTLFGGLAAEDRAAVEEQARVVADLRGVDEVSVGYDD